MTFCARMAPNGGLLRVFTKCNEILPRGEVERVFHIHFHGTTMTGSVARGGTVETLYSKCQEQRVSITLDNTAREATSVYGVKKSQLISLVIDYLNTLLQIRLDVSFHNRPVFSFRIINALSNYPIHSFFCIFVPAF